jgi:integrase/recombinase XerC
MRNHLPSFRASLRAPRTAKTYAHIVGQFLDFIERHAISSPAQADVERFVHRPRRDGRRAGPSTTNQEIAALRVFSRHVAKHGAAPLPVDGIAFEREPEREPCVMTAGEVRRLFEHAALHPDPFRRAQDLALLAVLAQLGLRVHEVVALNVDQIDVHSATLLAVMGKGATRSDMPLNVPTLTLLLAWLRERAKSVNADEHALFVSNRGTRLSIRTVERRFVELRSTLGTSKKITPHAARHSVATIGLSQGTDIVVISRLLRHARLATTMRYVHLLGSERREAVDRLGVLVPLELVAGAVVASPPADASPAENRQEPLDDHENLVDVPPPGPHLDAAA